MRTLHSLTAALIGCLLAIAPADLAAQSNVYTVPLTYNAPGDGPRPNFFPMGTQVELTAVPSEQALPPGAVHPARGGIIQIGLTPESWIPLLLTATADDPGLFTQLYLDMNRNGDFSDDGPPAVASIDRDERAGVVWYRSAGVELRVRFPEPERTEPYVVNFWFVQGADEPEPSSIIRYSNFSWR